MYNSRNESFARWFILILLCLLLAGSSLAQRNRFNPAPPDPVQPIPAPVQPPPFQQPVQPPVQPPPFQQPVQPASLGLAPTDDWLGAITRGGTVMLGAGEFVLSSALELVNPVTVTGQGMDETMILLEATDSEYLDQIAFLGDTTSRKAFTFENLSFVYYSEAPSDLLSTIDNVDLTLRGVRVFGAWDDFVAYDDPEDGSWWGVGVILGGGGRMVVSGSIFEMNSTYGILALGAESLTVDNSTFFGNWWAGVAIDGTPTVIRNSHFEANDIGIEVYGTASRTFENNTFEANTTQDVFEDGQ